MHENDTKKDFRNQNQHDRFGEGSGQTGDRKTTHEGGFDNDRQDTGTTGKEAQGNERESERGRSEHLTERERTSKFPTDDMPTSRR